MRFRRNLDVLFCQLFEKSCASKPIPQFFFAKQKGEIFFPGFFCFAKKSCFVTPKKTWVLMSRPFGPMMSSKFFFDAKGWVREIQTDSFALRRFFPGFFPQEKKPRFSQVWSHLPQSPLLVNTFLKPAKDLCGFFASLFFKKAERIRQQAP